MDETIFPIARFLLTRDMLENGTIPLDGEVAQALSRKPKVIRMGIATPNSEPVPAIAHWSERVIRCPKLKSLIGDTTLFAAGEEWFLLCAVRNVSGIFVIVLAREAWIWWNELEERSTSRSGGRADFRDSSTARHSRSSTRVGKAAAPRRAPAPSSGQPSGPEPASAPESHPASTEPASAPESPYEPASASDPAPPDFDAEAWKLVDTRLISSPGSPITLDNPSVKALVALLESGAFDTIAQSRVHGKSLQLSMSPGFDQLLSLDAVRGIVPFEYQVGVVCQVLQRMRGRAILADEVGLGKTIEAGLILMEYIMRGLVRRVLVLCPPPLISQWRGELESKFGLGFVASDDPAFVSQPDPWASEDRIIASIDTAKREPHFSRIVSTPFDMIIVDEAHRCRNKNTLTWKLVNSVQKKYILLLTATPVQNDLSELFNMITLVRPGQLETASEFSRNYITRGDRLKPRNAADLRDLMRDIMIRNRRETCGVELPRRRAETVRIAPDPDEASLYARITDEVRGLFRGMHSSQAHEQLRLALKTLQKEAGSSMLAAAPTLDRLADTLRSRGRAEAAEHLEDLADVGVSMRSSAKAEALISLIKQAHTKVLVFTGYRATLGMLARAMRDNGISHAVFSGDMSRRERDRAIEAFRGESQVLLSTETGGEGRNMQFCNVMVNYDLPWNPMRIEQRIGRIHRIGQEKEVYVFNLSVDGTLESHILDVLDAKINMFELVIGELDMILGNIQDEEDFEDTVMDIWAGAASEAEAADGMRALGDRLAQAKAEYQKTRDYEDRLFGTDLGTEQEP
ncbi:MAG: SNF2-related protein [Clostridia bacterium]|nr:SNF2-related protein [Clostridia bacterium]